MNLTRPTEPMVSLSLSVSAPPSLSSSSFEIRVCTDQRLPLPSKFIPRKQCIQRPPWPLCLSVQIVLLVSKDSNTHKISQKVRIQNLIERHTMAKLHRRRRRHCTRGPPPPLRAGLRGQITPARAPSPPLPTLPCLAQTANKFDAATPFLLLWASERLAKLTTCN